MNVFAFLQSFTALTDGDKQFNFCSVNSDILHLLMLFDKGLVFVVLDPKIYEGEEFFHGLDVTTIQRA